jgi:hypothetical protein
MYRSVVSAALLLTVVLTGSAWAASAERYEYRIIHPSYGDIGTYTNTVDRLGDTTVVRTELHIAVRLLGIVFYRQEAERTERWRGQRLIAFDGTTVTNGASLKVHGRARGSVFVVTTPSGTVDAPANVHPSNPWSPMVLDTDVMMSTKNGRVQPARVSGGQIEPVSLPGGTRQLRQYEIVTDKHQFVWLDDHGTAVAFQTPEKGTPVEFVLTRQVQLAERER